MAFGIRWLLVVMMSFTALPDLNLDELVSGAVDYLMGDVAHEFNVYGAAKEAYESRDREVLLSGPAGTGKSRAWLEKIHRAMLDYPGARTLIARKTRASLSESTLVTFEEHVLGEEHPLLMGKAGRPIERNNRSNYQYPNGSRIVLGGMDKPTRILSSEYDIIYVPEAIELTLEDIETLITRLRNGVMPYQQLMMDTNPDAETHWLYQRCLAGATRMIRSTHEDNPVLFNHLAGEWTERGKEYIFGVLESLSGVRKERYRYGRWVTAEGAVYEDYDPTLHLINRFEIPKWWRRFIVVDYGYTNPFTAQWWAMDDDGRLYMYREIYKTKRTVAVHSDHIKRLTAGIPVERWEQMDEGEKRRAYKEGERIEAIIADHDAEDRATMHEAGLMTTPARKDIKRGIERVQERLKKAGDGKPRAFILRDSLVEVDEDLKARAKPTSLAEELPGYIYPKAQDGKPVKEIPVDIDNHGADNFRYMVMHVDDVKGSAGGQVKYRVRGRR